MQERYSKKGEHLAEKTAQVAIVSGRERRVGKAADV
jgi:hypothetical protein